MGLILEARGSLTTFGSVEGIVRMRLCCSVIRTRFSNAFDDDTSNIESSTEDISASSLRLMLIYLPTTVSDEQTERIGFCGCIAFVHIKLNIRVHF